MWVPSFKFLNLIVEEFLPGDRTIDQVAKSIGCSRRSVRRAIAALDKAGATVSIGEDDKVVHIQGLSEIMSRLRHHDDFKMKAKQALVLSRRAL